MGIFFTEMDVDSDLFPLICGQMKRISAGYFVYIKTAKITEKFTFKK